MREATMGRDRMPDLAATEPTNAIEITPEMIAAGMEEYALFDSRDCGEWVVAAVYRAMETVRACRGAGTCLQLSAAQHP
jgi:hypothetical protein